jgi:ABC-type bacteriocin/lantibiotic exporter with double-glycine peptidase domain
MIRSRFLTLFIFSFVALSTAPWTAGASISCLRKLAPIVLQDEEYTCGPACFSSVIQKKGRGDFAEQELVRFLGTTSTDGTSPEQMLLGLKNFGFFPKVHQPMNPKDLINGLKNDRLFFLLVDAENEAHWVLASGKPNQGRVRLMDPWLKRHAYRYVTKKQLLEIWQTEYKGIPYIRYGIEI